MKKIFASLLTIFFLVNLAAGGTTWTSFNDGLPEPFEKVYDLKTFDLCPPMASGWGFNEMIVACTRGGLYGRFNSYDGLSGDTLWRKLHNGVFHSVAVNEISKAVYAADGMELLKSSDRGETWEMLYMASESHMINRGLAVTPLDTNLIYCNISWWTGTDGVLIKSTDGGGTWRTCDASMKCNSVNCIAIHPANPDTLFAATDSGLYRSFDGGEHFTRVFPDFGVHTVDVNPFNPDEVILGTQGSSWSHGFYQSVDNGDNWDLFYLVPGNLVVRYDRYNENRIFFSEADSSQSKTPPIMVGNDGSGNLERITQGAGFDCMNCICISAIVNHCVMGGTVGMGVLRLDTDATGIRMDAGPVTCPVSWMPDQARFSVFDPLGRLLPGASKDRFLGHEGRTAYGTYIISTENIKRKTHKTVLFMGQVTDSSQD